MEPDPQLDALIQEIHSQESEIRQTLRSSTQTANLSAVVLAIAAAGGSSQGLGSAAFSALPVFLTVVALSNLNAAIDAAHMSEQRDWLARRANKKLGEPVFVTGYLASLRRSSRSGVAVNLLAAVILAGSWIVGLIAAYHHPWFPLQIPVTALLIGLSAVAFSDFATTRTRARRALQVVEARSLEASVELPGQPLRSVDARPKSEAPPTT